MKINDIKYRKGIFLMFEGLPPTIADSQVCTHVREMKQLGVDMEIWSGALRSSTYNESLKRVNMVKDSANTNVFLFKGVRASLPFSGLFNALIIQRKLKKLPNDIDFIHARTDYAAYVCGYLKLFRDLTFIWDCRGDSEAEFCLENHPENPLQSLIKWYEVKHIRRRINVASKKCNKALFVSDKLKEEKGHLLKEQCSEIVPCTASTKFFFFTEKIRKEYRAKLGYTDTDKVMIYSGSIAPWQCFEESIELFKKLHSLDNSIKLLLLTPYIDSVASYTTNLSDGSYKVMNVPFSEVNAYLNAADFGIMLRRYDPINAVASPVKFAEYCLSGLPIIMNSSISSAYEIAKYLNSIIYYNFDVLPAGLEKYNNKKRSEIADKAKNILSREVNVDKYLKIYDV